MEKAKNACRNNGHNAQTVQDAVHLIIRMKKKCGKWFIVGAPATHKIIHVD